MIFSRLATLAVLLLATSAIAQEVVQLPPPENLASPPAGAIKHSEGLYYIVLKPGSGKLPSKQYIQNITSAWTQADGKTRFNGEEEGASANDPASIAEMVPGMATAMKETPIGEKRRWWIDAELLQPAWKGFAPGDYTVDMEIVGELDPLPAPDDVAQSPADATTTESGLRFKVLEAGDGGASPTAADMVTVHYSGWTTDGKMFDSSVIRGIPADFPVGGLIAGMTEGLQLMTLGDTARMWIPKDLAYGDNPRPGAPYGELIFDVELIAIKPAQEQGAE